MSPEDQNAQTHEQQQQQELDFAGEFGDGGDGEYGDFDQMFDPLQAFAQLFVAQSDRANGGTETLAEILASIRDILDKGVKVLYKMSVHQQQQKH